MTRFSMVASAAARGPDRRDRASSRARSGTSRGPRPPVQLQGRLRRFAATEAREEGPKCARCSPSAIAWSSSGSIPSVIERRLGVPAYNLAVPGTPPALTLALLRRALDAGARPSAVLIGHLTLAGDPGAYAAELAEVLAIEECLDLSWRARDPSLFGTLATGQAAPLAAISPCRAGARRDDAARHGGPPLPIERFRDNWLANRGHGASGRRRCIDGVLELGPGTIGLRKRVESARAARELRPPHRRASAIAGHPGLLARPAVDPFGPGATGRRRGSTSVTRGTFEPSRRGRPT